MFFFLGTLAYLTNPTSATFRTHLTSLSFHTHLRRLSSGSEIPPTPTSVGTTTRSRPRSPPSHVLSFSNRISLSVTTPPFTFDSFIFFSIVHMRRPSPIGVGYPPLLVEGKFAEEDEEECEMYIGLLGKWYPLRWWSEASEEEERRVRLDKAVLKMDVEEEIVTRGMSRIGATFK